mmetsp:Transcript_26941/g.74056  ORF Transcript_26941/g.74056 Transcript_26941/m.74056 type:complete len:489 (+) Transcript_26941:335-1801(+)
MMHVVHSKGRHSPRRTSDSSFSIDKTKKTKHRSSIESISSLLPASTKSAARKKETSDSRKNANKMKGRNSGETLQRPQQSPRPDFPSPPLVSTNTTERVLSTAIATDSTSKTPVSNNNNNNNSNRVDQARTKPSPSRNRRSVASPTRGSNPFLERPPPGQDEWAAVGTSVEESQALNDSLVFSTSVILSSKAVKNRRNSLGSKNELNDSRKWKTSKLLTRNHSMTKIEMHPARSPDAKATQTRKQLNNVQNRLERRGSLFDVFVWSAKENVDKLMKRKKKLNHTTRKPKKGYPCRDSLPSLVSLAFEDDGEGNTVSTEDTACTDNCNRVEKVGGTKCSSDSEAKALKVNSSPLVSTAVSTSFRVDNDPARDENSHEQNAVKRLQLSAARTFEHDEEFAKTETGRVGNLSSIEYFENLRSRWDSSSRIIIQADPAMPCFRRGQERRSNQHHPSKLPNSSKRSKAPRAPKTPRPSKKSIGNEVDTMPLIL